MCPSYTNTSGVNCYLVYIYSAVYTVVYIYSAPVCTLLYVCVIPLCIYDSPTTYELSIIYYMNSEVATTVDDKN